MRYEQIAIEICELKTQIAKLQQENAELKKRLNPEEPLDVDEYYKEELDK